MKAAEVLRLIVSCGGKISKRKPFVLRKKLVSLCADIYENLFFDERDGSVFLHINFMFLQKRNMQLLESPLESENIARMLAEEFFIFLDSIR